MRFNEFNKITEDIGLPTEKGTTNSWMAKSALGNTLDRLQDPADRAYQEKPAYQRAGKPEPITRPVPGTKPSVNLSDPKQAAAYKAALDLEKPVTNRATDSAGRVSPGEPTMGVDNPETKIKSGVNPTVTRTEPTMGPSTSPKPSNIPTLDPVKDAATTTGKAATKSIGRKVLGKAIPFAGSALDAEEAYNRYQRGDRTGAVISALGAAGGLVPGLGAPVSWGAMGLNAIKDTTGLTDKEEAAYQARQAQAAQQGPSNTPPGNVLAQPSIKQASQTMNANIKNYKDNQAKLAAAQAEPGSGSTYVQPNLTPAQKAQIKPAPVPLSTRLGIDDAPGFINARKQQQLAAAQAAQGSGSTVQRSTYTTDQQAIKDRIANTQAQQTANRGIEQPKQLQQPRQSYAGTAGAQAIQRANPDTIKNVNDIKVGDTISLPNGTPYTVKPGDTLDKIAQNQSTTQSTTLTPRPSITQTQASDDSVDDTYRNQNLERMKNQANQASTTVTSPTKQDASSVQAEEVNPLHRIKSLAGLK